MLILNKIVTITKMA